MLLGNKLISVAAHELIFWGDLKLFNLNSLQQRTKKKLIILQYYIFS